MNMVIGMIIWRPHLAVLMSGLLVGLMFAWGFLIYRNLLTRMSRERAVLLIIPRAIIAVMFVVALLDPIWSRSVPVRTTDRILAALDVSSSMDVKDVGNRSRIARARDAMQKIKSGLPSGMSLKTLEFDTKLREQGSPLQQEAREGVRNTDLGAVLLSLSKRADLSSYAGIVLLTDGGDEPVENIELPAIPLHIVGIGSDLSTANDLAIVNVRCPASVEKEGAFEINVDLSARNPAVFTGKGIAHVPLALEREENNHWIKENEQLVDLSKGWLQVVFKTTCHSPGLQRFRISLKELPGELSALNNSRILTVDVRKKSLHVLFFARELGMDLKMLRSELIRDPGVTFTAMFRTIGERFTVQGERFPGDESLDSGFPSDVNVLKQFDCVIIGSVSAREWSVGQMAALKTYVENGGAVVFLGDETSFGSNGYAATSIASLVPWEASTGAGMIMRGEFAVSIPAGAANHPIVAGMNELLSRLGAATVASVIPVGNLKGGSVALMTVGIDARSVPLVAVQRYGKGTVLALASNTFWKWARQSDDLQKAYGLFWRQAIRNLASNVEGGQILSVRWDKEFYKPGEKATAMVRASVSRETADLSLTASLTRGRDVSQIPVEPLQGDPGAFNARLLFEQRGTYSFQLVAHQGNSSIETYDKVFQVAPLLGEGARLELDSRALTKLAQCGGGSYVCEQDVDKLIGALTAAQMSRTVTSDVSPLSDGRWFAIAFLFVLVCEWIIRRKMNLF